MLKLANLAHFQDDDYQIKRNRNAVEIRKGNRDHIFQDTRNTRNHDSIKQQKVQRRLLIVDVSLQAQITKLLRAEYSINDLDQLIRWIGSDNILEKHHGIIGLRKILSIRSEPQDLPQNKFIKIRLVQKLLSLAQQTEYPQLQLESIWTLANLVACSTPLCTNIVQSNGVTILVQLLDCKIDGVIEQVVWALANICNDNFRYRDQIIAKGAIIKLVEITALQIGKQGLDDFCWALSSLSIGQPLPEYAKVQKALCFLCHILARGLIKDLQTFYNCCWAIAYHCQGTKQRQKPVMQSKLLDVLIPLMRQSNDPSLLVPCLRVVGNISAGSVECTKYLFDHKVLPCVQQLLYSNSKSVRHEICRTLSNLAASDAGQVQQIYKNVQLMKKLAVMLIEESDDNKREICCIFGNLARANHEIQVKLDELYLKLGIIENLVNILREIKSISIIQAIDCLICIIQMSQARKGSKTKGCVVSYLQQDWVIQILQKLQCSDDSKVYELSQCLLTCCFQVREETSLA